MKEAKVVDRDLRKEISEDLMKVYEKEFLEMKMKEIKREKEEVKKEADEDFLFTYEKDPKMPKKEILRKKIGNGRNCKTVTKYQCEICQKYLIRKEGLKRHLELHFRPQSFECKTCKKIFMRKRFLKVHVCLSSTCPHCKVKLKKSAYIKTHLRKIHGIKINTDKLLCDYCGCGFTAIGFLSHHLTSGTCRELKVPYSCDLCDKTFASKAKLRDHVLTHSHYKIECEICHAEMHRGSLKRHMMSFHLLKDQSLSCQVCSKDFKSLFLLKAHAKNHDKSFKCEKCDRKFSNRGLLNYHTKVHDNPEQFQCKICGRQLKTTFGLSYHLETHGENREKNFECNRCELKFHKKSHLNAHLKFHERVDKKLNENPNAVKCEKCPTILSNLKLLKCHMRFKHGNRPKMHCDLCKFSTIYKPSITKHLKNHQKVL